VGDQGREGVIGRGEVRGDADGGAIVAAAGRPTRRGELDALRALVVVGLVLFHTAVIFGAGEFPVKAAAENRVVTVLIAFGAIWGCRCCS
jgi:glucans biosynthesis protein C